MQRTPKQQAALEVYCRNMAKALNDAGFDQKSVLIKLTGSHARLISFWYAGETDKAILYARNKIPEFSDFMKTWESASGGGFNVFAGHCLKLIVSVLESRVEALEVPNTQESIKDIFRSVMTIMYPEKRSTTELNTMEIQLVYDAVNRAFSERAGISIDWPSYEAPTIGDYIEHSKRQV